MLAPEKRTKFDFLNFAKSSDSLSVMAGKSKLEMVRSLTPNLMPEIRSGDVAEAAGAFSSSSLLPQTGWSCRWPPPAGLLRCRNGASPGQLGGRPMQHGAGFQPLKVVSAGLIGVLLGNNLARTPCLARYGGFPIIRSVHDVPPVLDGVEVLSNQKGPA